MKKKKKYHHGGYTNSMTRHERGCDCVIHEDRNAIANLPQEVMMMQYPHVEYGAFVTMDDSIRYSDRQMREDRKGMRKNNEKY